MSPPKEEAEILCLTIKFIVISNLITAITVEAKYTQEEYTYFETFILYLFDSKIQCREGKKNFPLPF